jgi:hypothetical protein
MKCLTYYMLNLDIKKNTELFAFMKSELNDCNKNKNEHKSSPLPPPSHTHTHTHTQTHYKV